MQILSETANSLFSLEGPGVVKDILGGAGHILYKITPLKWVANKGVNLFTTKPAQIFSKAILGEYNEPVQNAFGFVSDKLSDAETFGKDTLKQAKLSIEETVSNVKSNIESSDVYEQVKENVEGAFSNIKATAEDILNKVDKVNDQA